MGDAVSTRTVRDFGDQWTRYRKNEGYYASQALLADLVGPFQSELSIAGSTVADIGSGTGRIVRMLADAGAARVVAVEPSNAFFVLEENTRDIADRVQYVHGPGDSLPASTGLDLVVSFGVLHHIPDPAPTVARCFAALRPGGKMLAWLYGHEGNELYLSLVNPVRSVTTRLPHAMLAAVSWAVSLPADTYTWLCHRIPLPMAEYMVNHYGKLSPEVRRLTIYDQLNPAFAKYYKRDEAEDLLRRAGFVDVRVHHRHEYSWTVIGTKPHGVRTE